MSSTSLRGRISRLGNVLNDSRMPAAFGLARQSGVILAQIRNCLPQFGRHCAACIVTDKTLVVYGYSPAATFELRFLRPEIELAMEASGIFGISQIAFKTMLCRLDHGSRDSVILVPSLEVIRLLQDYADGGDDALATSLRRLSKTLESHQTKKAPQATVS